MPIADHLLPKNTPGVAGSIDPAFLFADGKTLEEIQRAGSMCTALSASEKHRLVEAAKSPTRIFSASVLGKIKFDLKKPVVGQRVELVGPPDRFATVIERDIAAKKLQQLELFQSQRCDEVGSQTVIQFREWSNEWRIRTQINGTVGTAPPSQAGLRISKMLSSGGARKIADSCEYMAKSRGGFKTFVTGTFDDEARARIASGETSIQREATRALDALSKMYSRGWITKAGKKIEGHSDALAYCWVVEVPKNADGQDNPHIHLLLDWVVEYADFREWVARIESIWGNGYFHMEKIDDPLCAGAYMAKAAGYITKAAGASDQGTVSGNRYAISKAARAPAWSTLGTYQLGIMGLLIRDVYDAISARHSDKFLERHRLRAEREKIREKAKAAQAGDSKKYPLWAKNALTDIGEKLTAVRAQINALPVRASKYQLIIKGAEHFERFIAWATECGWHWKERPASHWMKRFREGMQQRKRARGAAFDHEIAAWVQERWQRLKNAMDLSAWASYETAMAA